MTSISCVWWSLLLVSVSAAGSAPYDSAPVSPSPPFCSSRPAREVQFGMLRALLLISAFARVTESKSFDCAFVLTVETYNYPENGYYLHYIHYLYYF